MEIAKLKAQQKLKNNYKSILCVSSAVQQCVSKCVYNQASE